MNNDKPALTDTEKLNALADWLNIRFPEKPGADEVQRDLRRIAAALDAANARAERAEAECEKARRGNLEIFEHQRLADAARAEKAEARSAMLVEALRDLSQVANRVVLSGHEPHQNELKRATGAAIAALSSEPKPLVDYRQHAEAFASAVEGCGICGGAGFYMRTPVCFRCDDSGEDHECDDRQVKTECVYCRRFLPALASYRAALAGQTKKGEGE